MNTTEVGGAPALNGLQALTTVNYFITNPNFAPQQSTTNNIIIMNKRQGNSANVLSKMQAIPGSSASVQRKKGQDEINSGKQPNELAKLFGNEKNF